MDTRKKKVLKAVTVLLAFSFAQVYVQAGLPSPAPPGGAPQQFIARLTTRGNRPILVNGASVSTGGSVLTGATLETPDQVSAKIELSDGSTVEVGPNSKIELSFDKDGNVHVKVLRGCAMAKKKANGIGEADVFTDQVSDKTDKERHNAGGCLLPNGQFGSFPGGGLTGVEEAIVFGGAAVGIIVGVVLIRGGNPSPSN